MSKKTLNVDAITNELQGSSLFFTKPTHSPAPLPTDDSQTNPQTISSKSNNEVAKPAEIKPIQTSEAFESGTENANERSNERSDERTNVQTNERSKEQKNDSSIDQTNGRTNERKIERTKKRTTLRHSFDIFADQLLALKEISLNREKITAEKVLLGDLAKEAFDLLISQEKTK
jgi:hypothetical protein